MDSATSSGEFQEVTCKKWFTFRLTSDPWALKHGLPFEIDVLGGVRFAKVLKTVVHVCCDEAEDGCPVMEAWKIKNRILYAREPRKTP